MDCKCVTCSDLAELVTAAVQEMSPKEKAQLRMSLRKEHQLPYVPEPDLWVN